MKKIISTIMLFALTVSFIPSAFAASISAFTDIPSNHWAVSAISQAVERGFMQGTSATTFEPDRTVSYAELLAMITRQFFEKDIASIDTSTWYAGNINAANKNKLLDTCNMSSPVATVNRYEMSNIIQRTMVALNIDPTENPDTSKIADWNTVPDQYHSGVAACTVAGLITGVDNKGTFNGNGSMTRAQAAAVINRLIDYDAAAAESEVKHYTAMRGVKGSGVVLQDDGVYHLDPEKVIGGGFCTIEFEVAGYKYFEFDIKSDSRYPTEFTITSYDQVGLGIPFTAQEKHVLQPGTTTHFKIECPEDLIILCPKFGSEIQDKYNYGLGSIFGVLAPEAWISNVTLSK